MFLWDSSRHLIGSVYNLNKKQFRLYFFIEHNILNNPYIQYLVYCVVFPSNTVILSCFYFGCIFDNNYVRLLKV